MITITPYRLRPYRGSVDIFASDENESQGGASWRHLVSGKVYIHRVPGSHFEILKPDYVPELAHAFRNALDRCR